MPIYNVASYVERALLSALNQTFGSIEFLLVDDRGTDNSMEIVRRIIKEHPRGKDVRIIEHPHNIGTGATKNTAIDNAQGEYLFFMDSDDEITPDCIQVLYDKMMEEKVDMVAGSYNIPSERIYYLPNETLCSNDGILSYVYKEKLPLPIYTWNKLYDISFLRRNDIRCVSYHTCEDNIFCFKILMSASSVSFVSQVTYIYYQYATSFMGRLKNFGFSEKVACMHADIITYKVDRCQDADPEDHMMKYVFSSIYNESIRYMLRLANSNLRYSVKIQNLKRFKSIDKLDIDTSVLSFKQKVRYYMFSNISHMGVLLCVLKLYTFIVNLRIVR